MECWGKEFQKLDVGPILKNEGSMPYNIILSCPILALFKATRKGFRNVNLNYIDYILMFFSE